MKIRRNDIVVIIAGKDKGKRGKVRESLPDESRVVVEGINMVKRHMKPRGTAKQAGIIELEASIHVSDVMILCSKCSRPTRIGIRFVEDGSKVRVCRRCGEMLD